MIIQWYRDDETARVFSPLDTVLAEFPYLPDRDMVDVRLRNFGFRRAEKWKQCAWGAEARLRKVKP